MSGVVGPVAGGLVSMRVARKAAEAAGIWSFELVPAGGGALPGWAAGAHVDVRLGGVTRQYSLWNGPGERDRYRIAVARDAGGRGGSVLMCDSLEAGAEVLASAPRNRFPLAAGARRSLLLAGGIGITPLLAMAQELAGQAADFTLHYCARSPGRAAFAGLLREGPLAPRAELHFDDGPPGQRLDIAAVVAAPAPGAHLYVCGPGGFTAAVRDAAARAGWPEGAVHHELFTAAADGAAKALETAGGDGFFEVRIASTGAVIGVPPGLTVTDALAGAGVEVPVSCGQGVCGTCLTRVIGGIPDHRDLYLSGAERARGDQFLPCCSRSRTPLLVLDL